MCECMSALSDVLYQNQIETDYVSLFLFSRRRSEKEKMFLFTSQQAVRSRLPREMFLFCGKRNFQLGSIAVCVLLRRLELACVPSVVRAQADINLIKNDSASSRWMTAIAIRKRKNCGAQCIQRATTMRSDIGTRFVSTHTARI